MVRKTCMILPTPALYSATYCVEHVHNAHHPPYIFQPSLLQFLVLMPALPSLKNKLKREKMPCSRSIFTVCIIWALLLLLISDAEASSSRRGSARSAASASAWLKNIGDDPRAITGCWNRPWICDREGKEEEDDDDDGEGGKEFPFPPVHHRRMCCKNKCIDVMNDNNNCGLCRMRCLYTWQCCNGMCIDVNLNPFHCGRCWKTCPLGSLCMFGMCDYAHLPPFPFPFPPKPPMPHQPSYPHHPSFPSQATAAQD